MSTLNSILSSINGQSRAAQPPPDPQRPPATRPLSTTVRVPTDGKTLTAKNVVAGVKRKPEEPEPQTRPPPVKEQRNGDPKSATAPTAASRFQSSTKPALPIKTATQLSNKPGLPTSPAKASPQASNGAAQAAAIPPKRGFASIMEKAKAAQQAATTAGTSGIKHKTVEKLSNRDRRRLQEEAKAQQRLSKSGKAKQHNTSGAVKASGEAVSRKVPEPSYKGTMRKLPEPLAYKGTMRAGAAGDSKDKKRKGEAHGKYGGYASWSDLDDAEEDEEEDDGYDSEGSSDMEGGFDDVEREERIATAAARKEDQEAQEEEDRLRREKMERKRKLEALNKSAKARKKY